MFTMYFWRLTLERAVKSGAQFAVAAFGANATGFIGISPGQIVVAALGGFVLSALTSVSTVSITGGDTPSVVPPVAKSAVVQEESPPEIHYGK